VAAVAPALLPGQTTVGIEVSLEHSRPALVGAPVEVQAELTEIDGRRLVFMFVAYARVPGDEGNEDDSVIGGGTVQRVLVDRDRFLARAGARPAT